MSRCLSDRTLLLIEDGERSSVQRTHLKECEACAARYRQLSRDLEAITQVLREQAPPLAATHPARPFALRWLPGAAVLALALLLVWAGVRQWKSPAVPSSAKGGENGETWSILDELPSNPFLLNEAWAVELATEGAGSYDLSTTILEAERPCEWYDLPPTGAAESSIETIEFPGSIPFAACVEVSQSRAKR